VGKVGLNGSGLKADLEGYSSSRKSSIGAVLLDCPVNSPTTTLRMHRCMISRPRIVFLIS